MNVIGIRSTEVEIGNHIPFGQGDHTWSEAVTAIQVNSEGEIQIWTEHTANDEPMEFSAFDSVVIVAEDEESHEN